MGSISISHHYSNYWCLYRSDRLCWCFLLPAGSLVHARTLQPCPLMTASLFHLISRPLHPTMMNTLSLAIPHKWGFVSPSLFLASWTSPGIRQPRLLQSWVMTYWPACAFLIDHLSSLVSVLDNACVSWAQSRGPWSVFEESLSSRCLLKINPRWKFQGLSTSFFFLPHYWGQHLAT